MNPWTDLTDSDWRPPDEVEFSIRPMATALLSELRDVVDHLPVRAAGDLAQVLGALGGLESAVNAVALCDPAEARGTVLHITTYGASPALWKPEKGNTE